MEEENSEKKKYARTVFLSEEEKNFFDIHGFKFKIWFFNIFRNAVILKKYKIDAKDVLEEKINDLQKDNNK